MKVKNKNNKVRKRYIDLRWISFITIIAFTITLLLTMSSDFIMKKINVVAGIFIILFFILMGVITDMIGIAVTSANEKSFHAMSTKKIKGAKVAIRLIRHASKVSAFCNDVIGDICNIMSGSAGIVIGNALSIKYDLNLVLVTLIITSLIAAFTIGGKASGKSIAISKSEVIVYEFAKLCSIFVK
jgi:CBS domain containing-hemolysin-like protein